MDTRHSSVPAQLQHGSCLRTSLSAILVCCCLVLAQGCSTRTAKAPDALDEMLSQGALANPCVIEAPSISTLLSLSPKLATEGLISAIEKAHQSDITLMGEQHNNLSHHKLQAAILTDLARASSKRVLGIKLTDKDKLPVLALEMVDVTKQPVLDKFNRGEISPAGLYEALDWQKNWGLDFALYLPIFEVAARYKIPVVALNLPKELVQQASEAKRSEVNPDPFTSPVVHSSLASLLPPHTIAPLPRHRDMLESQYKVHEKLPQKNGQPITLESFLYVQSLWDSAMAENAVKAWKKYKRPVIVLAGNNHVKYGFGIKHAIGTIAPEVKVLIISNVDAEMGMLVSKTTTAMMGHLPKGLGGIFPKQPPAATMEDVNPLHRPAAGDFVFFSHSIFDALLKP